MDNKNFRYIFNQLVALFSLSSRYGVHFKNREKFILNPNSKMRYLPLLAF